jgi:ribosomal protein S21
MNRNGNETESFAGNFVASDEQGLFFEVPLRQFKRTISSSRYLTEHFPHRYRSARQRNRIKARMACHNPGN